MPYLIKEKSLFHDHWEIMLSTIRVCDKMGQMYLMGTP